MTYIFLHSLFQNRLKKADTQFAVIIFIIFYMKNSSASSPKMNAKHFPSTLVLLPTTLNPRYLFPLPFVVESWKKLGVESVVLFIGDESKFHSNHQSRKTIAMLKEQNVYSILFYEPKKLPEVSMSQLIRLFCSALEFFIDFPPNETTLISSDADLMVFKLHNHVPNLGEGKSIHFYNSQCCPPISIPFLRGNNSKKVHQYPMGTIGATIKTWREIMGFKNIPLSIDEIEEYVLQEFGEEFFATKNGVVNRGSNIWFADQSLASYKIHEWLKIPDNQNAKSETPEYPKRINRNSWPNSFQFSRMNLSDFDDAHLPAAAYDNEEWQKFRPFLSFVFKNNPQILERFFKYREEFL